MLIDRESAVQTILELLENRQFALLKDELATSKAADIVDVIGDIPVRDRALVFRLLPKDMAIEVFEELPLEDQRLLLESFSDEYLAEILDEMSPDDRAELFEEMPAKVCDKLMHLISPSEREMTAKLLGYKENTAGRIMTPEYVAMHEDITVEEAIKRIRSVALNKETIYYVYITDKQRKLTGVVSLRKLVIADPKTLVSQIMSRDVIAVSTDTDQEEVAEVINKYDLLAVPVVDSEGRLVGIVTADDAADVMVEEATEDIQMLGGVEAIEMSYGKAGVFFLWRKRIVWLLLLLLTDFLSSSVIASFEGVLSKFVALAFFIPMLIDSGGNTGTQASTLIVRALGMGEITTKDWLRIFWKETRVGILIGTCLGGVVYARSFFWKGGPEIGLVVGLTMVILMLWANLVGTLLPIIFTRFRLDPAVISSPLITTLADVTGLLIYFRIAKMVLGI